MNRSKFIYIISMLIFSTIGIFRKYVPLSSEFVAFTRGVIGVLFLVFFIIFYKKKINKTSIKNNLLLLIISGCFIGLNWLFLFESYKYTSVATATLCYYMAPIFILLVSPIFLKEKLNKVNIICIIAALIGMVLVSGIIEVGFNDINTLKGVLFGLAAAILYASVVIMNKKIRSISPYDKTIVQLSFASIVLVPYLLGTGGFSNLVFDRDSIILLLIMGVIHTGLAYALFFGSMENISGQSIALFSYIDPVMAIVLSTIILDERMTIIQVIGAILILGFTLFNEYVSIKKK